MLSSLLKLAPVIFLSDSNKCVRNGHQSRDLISVGQRTLLFYSNMATSTSGKLYLKTNPKCETGQVFERTIVKQDYVTTWQKIHEVT